MSTQLLYRIPEAAQILAISRAQIYVEIAAGKIQTVSIGRARRIRAEALDAYVDSLSGSPGAA